MWPFPFDSVFNNLNNLYKLVYLQSCEMTCRKFQMSMSISFQEACRGVNKEVEINALETCWSCNGTKAAPGTSPQTCPQCHGTGMVGTGLIIWRFFCCCFLSFNKGLSMQSGIIIMGPPPCTPSQPVKLAFSSLKENFDCQKK